MYLKIFVNEFKMALREKSYIFWVLVFPICLGCLMHFAFGSIYSSNKTKEIPVAVVIEDNAVEEYGDMIKAAVIAGLDLSEFGADVPQEMIEEIKAKDLPFVKLLDELEYDDGTKMIKQVKTKGKKEREELLKKGDIYGIITVKGFEEVDLQISENGTYQSILISIIKSYRTNVDMIENVIEDKDLSLLDFEGAEQEINDCVKEKNLAGDNKDPFVTYFYNLIAMIVTLGAMGSLSSSINSKSNQSKVGMRVDVSPINKVAMALVQFFAIYIMQAIVTSIALTFYIKVLKVNFGGDTLMLYVTSLAATFFGVTLGMLIGQIGDASFNVKNAILLSISLGGGFMAGLMFGDMKPIIEEKCPIINRINPSAVITDAFYALNVFGVGDRYYRSMIYLIACSMICLIVSLFFARRKEYASL